LDRPVEDGIILERELLEPVRNAADAIINTSHFSVHDLKRYVRDHFTSETSELLLFVTSFSFREGLPRDADMVIDVRFLKNPHYDPLLRPLNGQDVPVQKFIEKDPDFEMFFKRLCDLLIPMLPRYREEGKSYFTIAVGCTGGKHRSVFVAEKLSGFLSDLGYKLAVRHRDLKPIT
jgi:RNase adapter protein RapZ